MISKLLADRVLLLPDKVEDKTTAGGIILTAEVQKKSMLATVVLTGPGAELPDGTRLPMEVKQGDRVIYNKHAAEHVQDDDVLYHLVYEEDILAIVSEDTEITELKEGLR